LNDSTTALSVREQLVIEPVPTADPTVGRWLGALQDARQITLEWLAGIDPRAIDFTRDDENTIGTLLYHIAAIEADWLYVEVLEQPFPPDVIDIFPHDVRETDGRLTPVPGLTLGEHLERLDAVREYLLTAFLDMSLTDFQRPHQLPNYDVTPEWVLHHLMQHEAEHRGQIGLLRTAAEHAFS
jgi:uncharacterized damage-inducible protein DinB